MMTNSMMANSVLELTHVALPEMLAGSAHLQHGLDVVLKTQRFMPKWHWVQNHVPFELTC
jgi:hypothetical protein